MLKFFPAYKRLSAGFCKCLHLDSSHSDVQTDHFIRTVQTEHRTAQNVRR